MRMLLVILAGSALAACAADPVGRRCDVGGHAGPDDILIATDSLDCASRLCLGVPDSEPMCTDTCATDDDCPRSPGSPCASGFTCAPVLRTGEWTCTPLCVCKDALDPGIASYCANR
jgi:hypothetical protein